MKKQKSNPKNVLANILKQKAKELYVANQSRIKETFSNETEIEMSFLKEIGLMSDDRIIDIAAGIFTNDFLNRVIDYLAREGKVRRIDSDKDNNNEIDNTQQK